MKKHPCFVWVFVSFHLHGASFGWRQVKERFSSGKTQTVLMRHGPAICSHAPRDQSTCSHTVTDTGIISSHTHDCRGGKWQESVSSSQYSPSHYTQAANICVESPIELPLTENVIKKAIYLKYIVYISWFEHKVPLLTLSHTHNPPQLCHCGWSTD